MIKTFRLRLALFSALLAGLGLLAFGMGSWWLIRDFRLERIDIDVRSQAEREVSRSRSPEEWRRIEANLVSSLGVRDDSDLLLLVQDGRGEILYRSPHWPAALDVHQFPWPNPQVASKPGGLGFILDFNAHAAADAAEPPRREEQDKRPEPRAPNPRPVLTSISQSADGHLWRIGLASTERARVAVAIDTQVIDADMRGIRNAFFVALPLALVLIGFAGWMFSNRALRPLKKLTAGAQRVTAEGLDQRISIEGEDHEFVELIEVFNSMMERLERSFKQAYRFSADAAHELKTPLAILQGQLERAIQTAGSRLNLQVELTGILDEVRRLSTISRKLLLLSQADAGRLSIFREPFDLSKALVDLIEDTRMMAPQLTVSGEIQPGLVIPADGSLLRQILHNLISNAIKYNVEKGWIRISAAASGPQWIEVQVVNSSKGIPAADRDKIFERFYRADPSHSRHIEGVGLGLSVSKEIARAHGGDISLEVNNDGSVQFTLRLPT